MNKKHYKSIFVIMTLLLTSFNCIFADDSKNIVTGQMKVVEGVTFLKLYGNYYEMGVQYGGFLKEPLLEVQKIVRVHKSEITSKSYKLYKNNMASQYRDFLKGISDSSGIALKYLLLGAISEDMNIDGTSILTRIESDGSSAILHAKNQDKKTILRKPVVIEFNPKNGYRYIVTQTVGAIFVHQGLNEKGIALTFNSASKDDYQPKNTLNVPLNLMILEYANSLYKAETILMDDKYNKKDDGSGIIILSSVCENTGAIYDIGHFKINKNELKDKQILFVTNNFSNELIPENFRYECVRYRIDGFIKKRSIKSVDDLVDVLALKPVNNIGTVHSIIFNAEKKEIYMTFSENYAAGSKWLKYNWETDEVTVYRSPFIPPFWL